MTLENQSFDKKLLSLKTQLEDIQKAIKQTETEKQIHINNTSRRVKLLQSSVVLAEVNLEVIDGEFFIIAKDDSFEYVMRLTKDQAESLADDLDHELNTQLEQQLVVPFDINQLFRPLFESPKIS